MRERRKGYSDIEVIYLWGMALTFPANTKKRDGADETVFMGKYEKKDEDFFVYEKTAEKFSVAEIMYMPCYVSENIDS